MKKPWPIRGVLGLVLMLAIHPSALAGDSLYGKVTEVRSADVVVLDYGAGKYVIRVVGVDVPKEGPAAVEAKAFVSKLVLEKNARIRLVRRLPNGEMEAKLLTGDPEAGIRDVALELVRAGLARRSGEDLQSDYKYSELTIAERTARESKRGLWATPQPR